MTGQHAILSPSGADRWMQCPGSVVLSKGLPNTSSVYADEGTAAHFLASESLRSGASPTDWIDYRIAVCPEGASWVWGDAKATGASVFEVDADMARYVSLFVDAVRAESTDGIMFSERPVRIETWTGEKDATGTADAIVIKPALRELQDHDLKYGQGERVPAERNRQLMLYALGALEEYELVYDFDTVRLFIHQPRISEIPSEWSCTVKELREFGREVQAAASRVEEAKAADGAVEAFLSPGEKQCRWCLAKSSCPALAALVEKEVTDVFEDLDAMDAEPTPETLDLVEHWLKAKRGEIERRIFAGEKLMHWKLVQGKRGARAWSDPAEAETVLKSMRLKVDEMYDLKLISPTSVEKIFGPKGSAPSTKRWNKLQGLISQSEGKPSVAPMNDPRPALELEPPTAGFDDLTGEDLT